MIGEELVVDIVSVGVSPFLLLWGFLGFPGLVSEVFLWGFSLGFISSHKGTNIECVYIFMMTRFSWVQVQEINFATC